MRKMVVGYAATLNEAKLSLRNIGWKYDCAHKTHENISYFIVKATTTTKLGYKRVVFVNQPTVFQYFDILRKEGHNQDNHNFVIVQNHDKLDFWSK